jgi:hypothetical protein
MKRSALFLLAALFLFACKNGSKKNTVTVTSDDGKTTATVDLTDAASKVEDWKKKMEEMQKLPALSTDQLKAMLPEELAGMKRTRFSANSMMGFGNAEATYRGDDDKEIKLNIIDCAGVAGAGYFNMMFMANMQRESEDENGYEKTIDFNGSRAYEKYSKYNDEYTLTYPASDRLLVSVEGQKTGLDAVKSVAQGLNLKVN